MDNTQAQVINNFRSLFNRYKANFKENERTTTITVDSKSVEIQKNRSSQTQIQSTKL